MSLHTKLFDIDFLHSVNKTYDTPCYIYAQELIEYAIKQYQNAFGSHIKYAIHYAVKANSNLSILSIIKNLGCGFDIVSIGELQRCLEIGADPAKIIFSGVGKTDKEIKQALAANIGCFNCESIEEIFIINEFAASMDKIAKIGLRINPDINPQTHPYIATGLAHNKFGVSMTETLQILKFYKNKQLTNINIIGLGFHIGSQLMDISPILQSIQSIIPLIDKFNQVSKVQHIDIGGGLGINYNMIPFKALNNNYNTNQDQANIDKSLNKYELYQRFNEHLFKPIYSLLNGVKMQLNKYKHLTILCEPGRSIVGYAGILLSKVLFVEKKDFLIIDASMCELIRPALYGAKHPIILLKENADNKELSELTMRNVDIVGPVCETGDFLGKQREIFNVNRNDLMCICHCGAYGFSMTMNYYNSRPQIMELLLDNFNEISIIKPRQSVASLYNDEKQLLQSRL